MIGKTNALSAAGVELSLVVSVTSGAAVTATKSGKTVTGTAAGGSCVLKLPEAGTWSVSATLNGQTSNTQSVSVKDSYAVSLTFFSATITVTVDSGASVALKKDGTTVQTKTSTGTPAHIQSSPQRAGRASAARSTSYPARPRTR